MGAEKTAQLSNANHADGNNEVNDVAVRGFAIDERGRRETIK